MKSTRWAWVWPIVALVLAQAIGLIAGIVAGGVYLALEPKLGIWRALAASCALALLAGVVVVAMLESA